METLTAERRNIWVHLLNLLPVSEFESSQSYEVAEDNVMSAMDTRWMDIKYYHSIERWWRFVKLW